MVVRPILDVDIDPEDRLGAYVKKFKDYEAALKKTPGVWAKAGAEAEGAVTSFEAGLAALLAMLDTARHLSSEEEKGKKKAKETASSWRDAAKWSKQFAGNVYSATLSLAKWVGIGSAISGLAGAGGLWGLDRLAGGAGAARRSAQGLGLSIGQQRAFETDLSRIVDPNAFLSGVSEALGDRQKRGNLYRAGLTGADLEGRNTFQVGLEAIRSIKRLVDATDPNALGNLIAARNLGSLGIDVETARRIRATSANDLSRFIGNAQSDQGAFGFDDKTAEKWQELDRVLTASKTKIEATLVRGLAPLAKPLTHLSDAVSTAIENLLGVNDPKRFKTISDGIDKFASYIGSQQFQSDMHKFATNIGILATDIESAVNKIDGFFHSGPVKAAVGAERAVAGAAGSVFSTAYDLGTRAVGAGAAIPSWLYSQFVGNNVGNLRVPGQSRFQGFPTVDAGVLAEAHQIDRTVRVHGARNLQELIGGRVDSNGKPQWGLSPKSDHNDVDRYVRFLAHETGLRPTDSINTGDNRLMSRLIAAISQVEGRHRVSQPVVLKILNNTGGSAVVAATQLHH